MSLRRLAYSFETWLIHKPVTWHGLFNLCKCDTTHLLVTCLILMSLSWLAYSFEIRIVHRWHDSLIQWKGYSLNESCHDIWHIFSASFFLFFLLYSIVIWRLRPSQLVGKCDSVCCLMTHRNLLSESTAGRLKIIFVCDLCVGEWSWVGRSQLDEYRVEQVFVVSPRGGKWGSHRALRSKFEFVQSPFWLVSYILICTIGWLWLVGSIKL